MQTDDIDNRIQKRIIAAILICFAAYIAFQIGLYLLVREHPEWNQIPTPNYSVVTIQGMPCLTINHGTAGITCDWSKWTGEPTPTSHGDK